MNCPRCSSPLAAHSDWGGVSDVLETRDALYGVRRRRRCRRCGHRWTTVEINAEKFLALLDIARIITPLIELLPQADVVKEMAMDADRLRITLDSPRLRSNTKE